jgi:hypothetical protein
MRCMRVFPAEIAVAADAVPGIGGGAAQACAFLEACAYPGIAQLLEATADERKELALERDSLGLDLQQVSCVYLASSIAGEVKARGRVFLRNVRHGLYLVPLSVELNIAIGCPVDPAFGLGGERLHNPYVEKLDAARQEGVEIDDELWQRLLQAGA